MGGAKAMEVLYIFARLCKNKRSRKNSMLIKKLYGFNLALTSSSFG